MIRVFLADDHPVVRDGLRKVIDGQLDMKVVGEAGDGWQVIDGLPTLDCDVMLLDLSLPGKSGIDVLKEIRVRRAGIKVLIFSVYPENQYSARLMKSGAAGYLSKGRSSDDVVSAIRTVASGQRYMTAKVASQMLNVQGAKEGLPHESLSERESDVLRRLAEGVTPTEIAEQLGLSVSTVGTYVARLKEKLGCTSIGEIVNYAFRHKLVE